MLRWEHDGNVVIESTVITHYLDDTFPTRPLMPRYPLDRTRAHLFKNLMDEYIHPACIVFTFATANRAPLASLSKEQRDAQLARAPLQRQSEYKRAAVEEGLGSPMGKEATHQREGQSLPRIIRAAMQIEVQPFRNEGKAVVP